MLLKEIANKRVFIFISISLFICLLLIYFIKPYEIGYFRFGHYLLNYEVEFLKRGFIGEIFRFVFKNTNYQFFNRFSNLLYIIFSISLLTIAIKYIKINIDKTGAWLFFIMFITSSATFQHFYLDIGRFEQFNYIFGFILLYLANKNIKIFYIFAPVLILIMLLTHEASLFIVIPFILVYFIYINNSKKNVIIAILLLVFSLVSTTIISTKGTMKSLTLEEHTNLLSKQHSEPIDGIYVVHKSTFKENSFSTLKKLLTKKTVQEHHKLFIYLFPFILLFGIFIVKDTKENNLQKRHFLILAAFAPLGLYIVGSDFYRWWALALTNFFLALMLISFFEKDFKDKLIEYIYKQQLLIFVIIINSLIFGAMGRNTAFSHF